MSNNMILETVYVEFPKPDVVPKPLISLEKNTDQRVTPPAPHEPSPALDLVELRKTQKRVSFLIEKANQQIENRYTVFPKPTYHGKCFLCRNNIGDPHTHYQSPKQQDGENQSISNTKRESIVIPSQWGYEEKNRGHVPKDGISNSPEAHKVRKKVTFPQINDNQKVTGRSGNETTAVSSKKQHKRIRNGKGFMSRAAILDPRDKGKQKKTIIAEMTNLGSWLDGDVDGESEIRTLEDHKHTYLKCPEGYTNDVIRGRPFQGNNWKKPQTAESNRSLSFGKWCECVKSDTTEGECQECSRQGGHEKWCRFRTGECPDCGKPVKGKYRVKFRSVSIHPFASSPPSTPTDLSMSASSSRESICRLEDPGSSTFTKTWKGKHKRKGKRISKRRHSSMQEGMLESALDPNIHRQAYLLALADSRLRKWRNDPWMFQSSSCSQYFSYFPLWKNPRSEIRSKTTPRIGIRGQQEKLKIKDPMKHILGPVKLSEYYPSGKKYPKELE